MKKRILSILLCGIVLISLFACSVNQIREEKFIASYCVQINNSFTLDTSSVEFNGIPKWHSENSKIVTVKDGRVTGKSLKGNAVTYVCADDDGIRYKWEIFVVEDEGRNGKPAYAQNEEQ